jgi:hypothetical protein
MKMKPQEHTHQYFDMVSFTKNQIDVLGKTSCKVKKDLLSNDLKQSKDLAEVDWQQELGLFLEIDLNKPVLRDMYLVNNSKDMVEYTATDKKFKVQYLAIKGTAENPTEINANLTDENQLYQTKKELQMKFENGKLVAYKIAGQQKIIFKDPLNYQMIGLVEYK